LGLCERNAGHDPGRVICDLAVMLADGGDCLADLRAVRDQADLFGAVASDSTAYRVIDKIASTPGTLEALERAHAQAREPVWKLTGAPPQVTIDVDATLLGSHFEKEGAAGNFKGGFGFYPMLAYCDQTRESMAACCAPPTPGQTAPPIRSRSLKRRCSRFRASTSKRSRCCCAQTARAPATSCWTERTQRTSASRSG
jgi:hypothetical protein